MNEILIMYGKIFDMQLKHTTLLSGIDSFIDGGKTSKTNIKNLIQSCRIRFLNDYKQIKAYAVKIGYPHDIRYIFGEQNLHYFCNEYNKRKRCL